MTTILQAVQSVVEHIKKTGVQDQVAIQKLWNQFDLSQSDIKILAQDGLAIRVGNVRRNPEASKQTNTRPTIKIGHVEVEKSPISKISMEVEILYETVYTINRVNKAFIDFEKVDCRAYVSDAQNRIHGIERHVDVMNYAERRLQKTGKKSIRDLAPGEQAILARKLKAVNKGQDGKQHDAENL